MIMTVDMNALWVALQAGLQKLLLGEPPVLREAVKAVKRKTDRLCLRITSASAQTDLNALANDAEDLTILALYLVLLLRGYQNAHAQEMQNAAKNTKH